MSYKVIQWTTGEVGKEAVRGILEHPELELVGCYAWSDAKDGKDVGELCGMAPLGIQATRDIDALIALGADCVCYTPNVPNSDDIVRLLEGGLNVVTTNTTDFSWGPDRDRIAEAADAGGASVFGSGIFPGVANFIAAQMAVVCGRFDKVHFLESVDVSLYDALYNYAKLGWGQKPSEQWVEANRSELGFYGECLNVMAQMLRVPVTRTAFDVEFALTPEDRTLSNFTMPAGTIAGQKCRWQAFVGDTAVIELEVMWRAGEGLEPSWPVHHGYTMEVVGDPNVHTRVRMSPQGPNPGIKEYMDLTDTVTAMPIVNAIPTVCEAAAGIRSYADLPLITATYRPAS